MDPFRYILKGQEFPDNCCLLKGLVWIFVLTGRYNDDVPANYMSRPIKGGSGTIDGRIKTKKE